MANDLGRHLAGSVLALLAALSPGLAVAQASPDQTIGKIGDWTMRCAAPGTPKGICFLVQRFEQASGGGLVAEIVADKKIVAVSVPAGASLATPMTVTFGTGSREFAWQACTADTCQAALALDADIIAGIQAGDASLSYVAGTAPTTLPLPGAGLGDGLNLLDAVASQGAAGLPPPPIRYITVRDVRFTPSFYLDDAELAAAIAPYIGRRLTVPDLAVLLTTINALYAEKGISLAQALMTDFDAKLGVVNIELFEARLGSIGYVAQNASDEYLAFRLGLKSGQPADNRLITEQLNRLALTDGVIVAADFQPGARRGDTDLTLTFEEPAPYWWYVGADNHGSKNTGFPRLSLGGGVRSLTGWNDPLGFDLVLTQGSVAGVVSYSRVVHPLGTRLGLSVDGSMSRTITSPEVTDQALAGTISLTHPVILEATRRWDLGGALVAFGEKGAIAGAPLVDQRGQGARLTSAVSFNGPGWAIASGQSLTLLKWDDAITAETGMLYAGLGGNIDAAFTVAEHFVLSVEAAGQLTAAGRAPAKYQFAVSGPRAVRGYASELSQGDSGFYARLQLGLAAPVPIGTSGGTFSPYLFADAGRAYDKAGVALDPLASIGFGTAISFGKNLSGDIFFAKPLLDASGFSAANQYEIRASLLASF